jgi:hypothetical protein
MLSSTTPQVSPERLMQFTFGFAPPLMIETAIRYGVFDVLDKGARSLDGLCAETGTSRRGLRMILDALVGLDLLSKDDAGHYGLMEESATFLVAGKPTLSWRILSADQGANAFVLEQARGGGQKRTVGTPHQPRTGRGKLFPQVCRRYISDPLPRRAGASEGTRGSIDAGASLSPGFGRGFRCLECCDRTTIAADTRYRSRLAWGHPGYKESCRSPWSRGQIHVHCRRLAFGKFRSRT